jgi:ABC-type polysaccharide/polyol phosphate transport system ATPase subunit
MLGLSVVTSVLQVSGLSKKFAADLGRSLSYGLRDIASELLASSRSYGLRQGEFWALHDVSFDVSAGEALAIVGHNGAGKSVLLKTLYGLLKPDRGEVRISGRTEAIIELGTGFNGVLSGRENVEVVAGLHRLSAAKTRELIDNVIDFTEIGSFIEAPVLSYSSGMRARLSYAICAYLEPSLLLVDEVLAVGDLDFQHKCVRHMRNYIADGGALLLVSHNTHQIQSVCTRGLLLERGRAVLEGSAVEALSASFERQPNTSPAAPDVAAPNGPVSITQIRLNQGRQVIQSGDDLEVRVEYRCRGSLNMRWGLEIWTHDQLVCIYKAFRPEPVRLDRGGSLIATIKGLPLVAGHYVIRTGIVEISNDRAAAAAGVFPDVAKFHVTEAPSAGKNAQTTLGQLVHLPVDWQSGRDGRGVTR